MEVLSYARGAAAAWDEFVARAPMATLLHTRRYLSYHGERFSDVSVLLVDERQRVIAVFPAALDPDDDKCVISHPGVTYGGIVYDGGLGRERMVEAVYILFHHFTQQRSTRLRAKSVTYNYQPTPP